jgi:glycosyltransferase involved in cell wall biosynthesis
VVTIHDLAFEAWPQDFARATRAKYRVITPLAARSAERIICPSAFTVGDLARRYGIDPAKVRVIPEAPALPIDDRATADGAEDPYILAVGDLRPKKNLAALVVAYVNLRRRAAIPHRLVLAGMDTGEGPRLRALAGGEPVQLTGYVADARLDALLRGADVLVHPSLYEGFGLVVLEAMARRTSVLAAHATALPETGGEAAAYFDPAEPGDLEQQLEQLLDDPGRRRELGHAGRAHTEQFSWAVTARATAEVYRELV